MVSLATSYMIVDVINGFRKSRGPRMDFSGKLQMLGHTEQIAIESKLQISCLEANNYNKKAQSLVTVMDNLSKIRRKFSLDTVKCHRLGQLAHVTGQSQNFLNMFKTEKSDGVEGAKVNLLAFWSQCITNRDLMHSQQLAFVSDIKE